MVEEEVCLCDVSKRLVEGVNALTLVTWRNMTNGRLERVAASCSTPMTIPLSIKTAFP